MSSDLITYVLAGVHSPVVVIGNDNRILQANPAAAKLFGDNMEGRHFQTVMRQPSLLECVAASMAERKPRETRYQTSGLTHDSVYRVSCTPLPDPLGAGIVVSLEDVTPLEAAGQMRRDFVANVSHELRSPLTALMGFIETLRGPARDDAAVRERFLTTMEREAGRMNRLVNDLLSLSRVESDERVRPKDKVNLVDVVRSVCNLLEPNEKDIAITLLNADREWTIRGDADQLVQVFSNLIENAQKYGGDGGRIEVTFSHVERDPFLRSAAVQVDVADFGAGIEPVHLHRLTERFYRADNHRSRELGGTGLGLAIVKHIINRHRGRLKMVSEPGKGSVFSAIFPELQTGE